MKVLLIALAVGWLWSCVYCLRGKHILHRIGQIAMGTLAGVLVVWQGGDQLLGLLGLTWRSWINTVFLSIVILAVLVVPICATGIVAERYWILFAVACILCTAGVLIAGYLGLVVVVFSYSPERDLIWEGVPVVEEDHSFLDPTFTYYRKAGPFFKEEESFYYTHDESERLCPKESEHPEGQVTCFREAEERWRGDETFLERPASVSLGSFGWGPPAAWIKSPGWSGSFMPIWKS